MGASRELSEFASVVSVSSGNVGIGTSSPSQPLHVYSTAAAGKYIYAQHASNYNSGFQAQNSVSDWYAYAAAVTGNFEFFRGTGTGDVQVVSVAKLGYGTGSGGTVTQATNKSTAVTLNKPTGQITMNNAALGAGAAVAFGVNNTLCTTSDVVIVNANGFGSYRIEIQNVSSGNFAIRVTNVSGGSLSEAVVINFAIIKGATS